MITSAATARPLCRRRPVGVILSTGSPEMMAICPEAEKLEITSANSASYSLSLIELADVAPANLKPEETGLDKPTLVSATTLEGLSYTLKVGKVSGDSYYASIAIAGTPKPEGKDAEERLKKINERLPREKELAAYTLLISKSKLDDVLKKRADLLAKKEAKK